MTKPVESTVGGTSRLRIWWLAIRPATLTISLAPVLVGASLAWHDADRILWIPFVLAAAAALLIQIGTNLYNDVGDYERGADRAERLGPPRAVSSGWLEPGEVRRAVLLVFAIALVVGAWLVWHGGLPILLLGLASIAAGIAYTGGPRPIAYSATGELFVFVFFGLAAVLGTYYLQTFAWTWGGVLVACMIGSLAAAVIVVNNYRDLDNDRQVGKRTFAVRAGRVWSRLEFVLLLGAPYALLLALGGCTHAGWWLLLPFGSVPMAVWIAVRFLRERPGPGFNRILADTAQLQLTFSCLLAVALLL
ncbi:MAG: 1,4-dihydroxy-2-naphthoate polyprenyltransferase [Betaproteobacteria bacterium]|jgi:1,4-dihydroxy-2-naphthoate octaprenyltransferase|nr:1,4-dihydroxy-2-naphthoate polyprenyltransferase [Betaproteobacteria bacterium]